MKTNWQHQTGEEPGRREHHPEWCLASSQPGESSMKVCLRRCAAIGIAATLSLSWQSSARADIFVVSASEPAGHSEVFRLEERSGAVINRWVVGSETVNGIVVSMLGDVYVAGNTMGAGEVIRFSPAGEQLGGFSSSEYTLPSGLVFGSDGSLYALSTLVTEKGNFGQVLRFDPSGRYLRAFIPAQANTAGQFVDMAFAQGGDLLVLDYERGVLRFDGNSGLFMKVLVPAGDDLATPTGLAVGPDGNLYVSSRDANVVIRYDGTTGNYVDTFVSPGAQALNGPMGLTFGNDGNLYVASCYDHRVVRFDGKTGELKGVLVSQEQGLHFPTRLATGAVPFLMAAPTR